MPIPSAPIKSYAQRARGFVPSVLFVGIGTLVGAIAWCGITNLLPVSLVFPIAYGLATRRRDAALLAAGYFLAASRGLPEGAATFFGTGMGTGLVLWVAAALLFVTVHTCLWHLNPVRRAFGFLAATLLMAVPPLGALGWASPLTAAGVLFPAWGWAGLAAAALILVLLTHIRARHGLAAGAIAVIAWAVSILLISTETSSPQSWTGIDTEIGQASFDNAFALVQSAERAAQSTDDAVIVLPEGAAGWRTPTAERAWIRIAARYDKTIIAGFEMKNGEGSDNAVAIITADGFSTLYRQRMPVPFSMWKPWSKTGTNAYWVRQPVIEVEGRKVGFLICYEQILVWPILQSVAADADMTVGIANVWWAADTNVPDIQLAAMESWARLFGLESVEAFNR